VESSQKFQESSRSGFSKTDRFLKSANFFAKVGAEIRLFLRRHNSQATKGFAGLYRGVCMGIQRDANRKNQEIAVEKPNFSTLSTGFSTGVFHNGQ